MLINQEILEKTHLCFSQLLANNLKITIAESCTGGLLSFLFTYFSESSRILDCSFVTYSNNAKIKILGVDKQIIEDYGAVSQQTAVAMASGALDKSNANLSIATTGIAGPGGATNHKPVGLVYISCLLSNTDTEYREHYFQNINRNQMQLCTVNAALDFILYRIDNIK